ncbi:MAG: hypothetical protein ACI307_05845, partial [Sodaliphilus sp.]
FDFNCKRQFMNALETCRRHVPTLWCLRYGVVEFVDFVEFRANGAHYNIKRSRFLLVGEPALWGMCVGYALFGGVLAVVDYDEFADFGADSQLACCSHE